MRDTSPCQLLARFFIGDQTTDYNSQISQLTCKWCQSPPSRPHIRTRAPTRRRSWTCGSGAYRVLWKIKDQIWHAYKLVLEQRCSASISTNSAHNSTITNVKNSGNFTLLTLLKDYKLRHRSKIKEHPLAHPTRLMAQPKRSGRCCEHAPTRRPPLLPPWIVSLKGRSKIRDRKEAKVKYQSTEVLLVGRTLLFAVNYWTKFKDHHSLGRFRDLLPDEVLAGRDEIVEDVLEYLIIINWLI